ncbi:pleckstriny domain-containing family A member 2-like protein [Camelus ferus]|nr:pleckstriny domain-containing family A member 2-like protein [Camelus ferus]
MPYVDRQNRICGFLDIEENESSGKFLRSSGSSVGPLGVTQLALLSSLPFIGNFTLSFADAFINALSQRYFLQANDQKDLKDWVEALNQASKITVPKAGNLPLTTEVLKSLAVPPALEKKPQVAYKTEIIGGVVVHTPINQRKSWKRRFFALDDFTICYFKCEQDREPLRTIFLKDVLKTHECLVKSGGRPPVEERRALCKAPSVASSWQPWTPVPRAGEKLLPAEETLEDSLFTPRPGESGTAGVSPSSRMRHRSEPQHPKEKPFVFSLDDASIRTSDV